MLTTIAVATVVLAILVLLRWRGGVVRSREEVAKYIEDYLNGTGGEWDWDDFTSVRIRDPHLDRIRRECCEETRQAVLEALLDEVRGRAA